MKSYLNEADVKRLTGLSDTGRAWVEHYLHPPGRTPEMMRGYPDRALGATSKPYDRWDTPIAAPSDATDNWNCLCILLNNPSVPALILASKDLNFGTATWKPVYCPYFAAGRVPFQAGLNNFANIHSHTRTIARSCTAYLNAPSLEDQGMIFTTQTHFSEFAHVITQPASTGAGLVKGQYIDLDSLLGPDGDITEKIMAASPSSSSRLARDGAFMPLALSEDSNDYEPVLPEQSLFAFVENRTGTPKTWYFSPNGVVDDPTAATNMPTGNDHMNMGIILFTGISTKATVDFKMVQSVETRSPAGSQMVYYATPSANPDMAALDAAAMIRNTYPDSFPSSYNDLGGIFNILKKIASPILDVIGSPLMDLLPAALPEAAPFIAPVQSIAGSVRNLIGRKKKPKEAVAKKPVPAPRRRRTVPK